MKERIGIFGGTFAPPHTGHVRAAEAFLRAMNPEGIPGRMKLCVIPTGTPPHKEKAGDDTPALRLEMCRAAFGGLPDTEVSDIEIRRGGLSYTVNTLEELSAPDRELWLLCGSDMFLTLDRWYRADDIFRLANIVGISRGTEEFSALSEKKAYYEQHYGRPVTLLETEPFPLSSTRIRDRIACGGDLDGLVPPGVMAVIAREGLYGYGGRRKEMPDEAQLGRLAEAVRPYLTEKRYAHTLAVEREAARLGAVYLPERVNALRAYSLLHDITKKEDLEKQLQLCREFGIITEDADLLSPSVFHAKTGAAVAARDFPEFADGEILSGIRWHTTGRAGMTLFECIVYLADYIEETRTFDDCRRLRRDFYEGLESGRDPYEVLVDIMIESFDLTLDGLVRDGAPIASDTVAARNDFIVRRRRKEIDQR